MNTNLPVGPVHYAQDPLPLITSKHSTEMCHTSESCVLFTEPTNLFFSATFFFIKNESYSIIHTFKNYFATVFSVFNLQSN